MTANGIEAVGSDAIPTGSVSAVSFAVQVVGRVSVSQCWELAVCVCDDGDSRVDSDVSLKHT